MNNLSYFEASNTMRLEKDLEKTNGYRSAYAAILDRLSRPELADKHSSPAFNASPAPRPMPVSKTGCFICDQQRRAYCIHNKDSGSDDEMELEDTPAPTENPVMPNKGRTPAEQPQMHPEYSSPRLIFVPEHLKNEYAQQQENEYLLVMQPGLRVNLIKAVLEAFILDLAKQLQLNTQNVPLKTLGRQLGIEYTYSENAISITMRETPHYYNYLNRLQTQNLVKLPNALQDKLNAYNQGKETDQNNSATRFNPSPLNTTMRCR